MALPTPYFDDGQITVFNADCRDVLPGLAPGSVDLVLTDPPYGVGFNYGTGLRDSLDGYIEWLWPVLEMAERAVRPGGYVVCFQAAKYARHWGAWFPRDFRLIALPKTFVQMRPAALQWATDYALCWPVGKGEVGRNAKPIREWQPAPARDWFVCENNVFGPARGKHPCPRPIAGIRYLIGCLCPPGGAVLDPFLGGGSTARAAKDLGRRCIGVDLEATFCDVTVDWLRQGVLL